MYILDLTSDKSLKNAILYLTNSEASELKDSLEDILKKPSNNHAPISNDSFQKEITICIYDKNNLEGFDQRSKKLINDDQ